MKKEAININYWILTIYKKPACTLNKDITATSCGYIQNTQITATSCG